MVNVSAQSGKLASVLASHCSCANMSEIQKTDFLSMRSQVYKYKKNQRKIENIYFPIIFGICFGCSKEPSH